MPFFEKNLQFRTPLFQTFVLGLIAFFSIHTSFGQSGSIKGKLTDALTGESLPFANVYFDSTNTGTTTDLNGNYELSNLNPGTYNVTASFVGYQNQTRYEVRVPFNKPVILNFELAQSIENLDAVEIKGDVFIQRAESPISLKTISASEIYRSPGGNRDISQVIQNFPGITTTVSFRNDIIVRGGAPSENKFFLDGIPIPNINHFATQGSSGGPVGMLNVNFIREVELYTSAFPVNRGNALSSVMDFKQIQGNDTRLAGAVNVGSSDFGLTLDGPSGPKSSYIFSLRRSYLQFLFQALKLPFLPTYNDLQYKHDFQFNGNNKLTVIALGAIDNFELNSYVNEGETDSTVIKRNNYILGNLPVNEQWNYTVGANWSNWSEKGVSKLIFSRSHLNNTTQKFRDNIELPENNILDFESSEISHSSRFERKRKWNGNDVLFGLELNHWRYAVDNKQLLVQGASAVPVSMESQLDLLNYAAFFQTSTNAIKDRLTLGIGIRMEGVNYSNSMKNPIDQLSPRVSLKYILREDLNLVGSWGRYVQTPGLTTLGYRDSNNVLVNKMNNLRYIEAIHTVLGLEYKPSPYSIITLEAFKKDYAHYPVSTQRGIALANLGADFGVIGNEEVLSISEGRSFGIEFMAQQKLSTSVFGLLSYSYVRSAFNNGFGPYITSSWDNRNVLNLTVGKKMKRNWELGLKFRFSNGLPFTPYNEWLSARKEVWDANGQGVPNWRDLNGRVMSDFNSMDIRIDKTWYVRKTAINAYFDVQNVYGNTVKMQDYIDVVRDETGMPVENPADSDQYLTYRLENISGTVLPSVGLLIEF